MTVVALATDGKLLRRRWEADAFGSFAEQIVMWWNFVGYTREEIAKAQRDWESGDPRFGEVAGHEGKRLVAPGLPWGNV